MMADSCRTRQGGDLVQQQVRMRSARWGG